jgi:transcriptional regulator with XRE-family HTH domain
MRARRLELGYTLKDMADAIGRELATYQRYESGSIKGINTDILKAIADKLECSPLYLMGISDDINPTDNNRRRLEEEIEKLMLTLNEDQLAQARIYIEFLLSKKPEPDKGTKK